MKNIFLALFLVAVLVVSGCTQSAQQADSTLPKVPDEQVVKNNGTTETAGQKTAELSIVVSHKGYDPAEITVNKGDAVVILATTPSGQEWHKHGLAIDEYNLNIPVQASDSANPVKIDFVADKVGTFKIYCKTCNDEDGWKGKTGDDHPEILATLIVK